MLKYVFNIVLYNITLGLANIIISSIKNKYDPIWIKFIYLINKYDSDCIIYINVKNNIV